MAALIDEQIDALWDFSDPATSESRFAEAIEAARAGEELYRLALLTQHAEALGLQKRIAEAHAMLDDAVRSISFQRSAASEADAVRLLLERGRVLNSSGAKEEAQAMSERAWDEARAIQRDALAVDAAHMIAIASDSRKDALEWTLGEQMRLLHEWEAAGEQDGFVFEEVAEWLRELSRKDEAVPYFARACELL